MFNFMPCIECNLNCIIRANVINLRLLYVEVGIHSSTDQTEGFSVNIMLFGHDNLLDQMLNCLNFGIKSIVL